MWDLEPVIVRGGLPEMPAEADLDYRPMPAMAHAALPVWDAEAQVFTGSGRIWLKGSASCRSATVVDTGATVPLDPPYYTAVVEAPAGERIVEFGGAEARSVQISVPDAAPLNAHGADFSALFFGDLQPFVIQDDRVRVNPGPAIDARDRDGVPLTSLVAIRQTLLAAAQGALPSFAKPSFTCGIGDQVYVEGDYHDYHKYGQRHPMSAWTVEAQPRPRVGVADLPRFLDTCYRGHWSFTSLERALQVCPSLMVWDDHDIRDGWGSQGDEIVYRDSYFREFRGAFVEHQFKRGPRQWRDELAHIDAPLWQSFAIGGVPVFVMDLRTCRDISVPEVIGAEQWRVLRQWFADLDPDRCRHYVLVSSMPIFYRIADRANIAAAFSEEIRDDLLDTWTSEQNEPEWRQLITEITKAAERGMRAVVISGDYHLNSLCRVTASRDGADPQIIAYEMIFSGLAAESYSDWKQQLVRQGWLGETPIDIGSVQLHTEFGIAASCPSFGGLEFRGGEIAVSFFKADADGCVQQRVPLSWTDSSEDLDAVVGSSLIRLDPGSFGN